MRKLPFAFAGFVVLGVFAACGSEAGDDSIADADAGEAGIDGNTTNPGTSTSSSSSSSSGDPNDGGNKDGGPIAPDDRCKAAGAECVGTTECCTGACVNSKCGATQCVPDKPTPGTCSQNGECCSGLCTAGKCASINGTGGGSCRTAGNPCGVHGDCCSKLCQGGFCSGAVSFCTQENEICSNSTECCSGNCEKTGTNPTGLCKAPTAGGGVPSGCAPAGTVCGGSAGAPTGDAGIPPCDQNCCSRACGFFGAASGFRVCQPP